MSISNLFHNLRVDGMNEVSYEHKHEKGTSKFSLLLKSRLLYLSLQETVRYTLEYYLKWPLNKNNQQNSQSTNHPISSTYILPKKAYRH